MSRQEQPDRLAAAETEVTSEMIEAGLRVLLESGAVENPIQGLDPILVQEIFDAMIRAQRSRS